MLFPVTAYNANGKLKEVISKEILHRRHWKIFHNNEGITPAHGNRQSLKN